MPSDQSEQTSQALELAISGENELFNLNDYQLKNMSIRNSGFVKCVTG